MSRSQQIDTEAIDRQRTLEKETLTKAAGAAVPDSQQIASETMDDDGVSSNDEPEATQRKDSDPGPPGYHKLAKMTVPDKPTTLMRLQGTLTKCQDACNRASLCSGIEYSHRGGGVCILLRHGLRWSNTFDYYDKDTPDTSDPVRIAKHDEQLLWGKVSDRSHDLGGLAMNDVPGATVYKPPTKTEAKEQKARHVIQEMDRPVSLARTQNNIVAQSKLHTAKEVQSQVVITVGETRDISDAVKTKQLRVQFHDAKASLHAAQKNLSAEKLSAKALKQHKQYIRAKRQYNEYTKAATVFAAAGNPMADAMAKRASKWKAKAAHLRHSSKRVKAQAAIERLHAKMSDTDAAHWQQQTSWAGIDATRAANQLKKAVALESTADKTLAEKTKLAKEAEWKANCEPLCDLKRVKGWVNAGASIYSPEPVKTNPPLSSLPFEYDQRQEWEYDAKPAQLEQPNSRPAVVTNAEPELPST